MNAPLLPAATTVLSLLLLAGCGDDPAAEPEAEPDHHDHGEHEGLGDDEHGHADEVTLSDDAIARHGVTVGQAERRALAAEVVAPARVGFDEEAMAHVGTTVVGRVSEVRATLGDRVSAGEVLLVIDSPELGRLQGDYLAALAAAEAAQPAVEITGDAYERARSLFDESEGLPLTEVQARQADLRSAERELVLAESNATAAANALRLQGMTNDRIDRLAETRTVDPRYEVAAPIDGEVVERHATPGELVGPEDEALLTLADLSTVWVLADVAESLLAAVGVGSNATLSVPAVAGESFAGEVTYVDPRVDPHTRTARLRVEVNNTGGTLRPGMFARASFDASQSADALTVPASAVMEVEGKSSVFVPVDGEAGTFARRGVRVGPRVGDAYPVLAGLDAGDAVVTAGAFILKAEIGKAGVAHAH